MYKFGILTSLYDDEAPKLLKTIDGAIESGIIKGEVPLVFCDRREGRDAAVDARIGRVRQLRHLNNIALLPPSGFHITGDNEERRAQYDSAVAKILSDLGASSFLNIGYMRIMGPELYDRLDIVNLHPALPEIGPKGMWKDVMKEQAERPLHELTEAGNEAEMCRILQNRNYMAGGMLHLVSGEVDRGQVISWYEFPLTSSRLYEMWGQNAGNARTCGIEEAKKMQEFEELAGEIRREQVQGEHPLLVLTYSKLSRGDWSIRDRVLYAGNEPQQGGMNVSGEVGKYLREAVIETAIR
ncbi:MAG: Phosphoribosylglycinamide transformylase [archaeon GW2011_AR5]|nr:MAG: Phosphoribosylglycinamide transformylase [archaeon GW2011_AR5]